MKKIFHKLYKKSTKKLYGTGIGKFKLVNKINRYFVSQLKPDFVEIDGFRVFLDKNDSLGLSMNKMHEKMEREIVINEIKEGSIVVDVGAHIGYYTLLFSKIVGEKGKVFSFEAEPTNFKILKRNIEYNDCKNVICVNKAVSNKSDKIKLYTSNNSSAGNRFFETNNSKSIIIESITLDNYFKTFLDDIDFIKLDIQGAEPLAIEGMKSIIKNNKKLIIMQEWWPDGIKKLKRDPKNHLKELTDMGFKLIEVDELNEKINEISIEELIKKYPNEKIDDINLICKKII